MLNPLCRRCIHFASLTPDTNGSSPVIFFEVNQTRVSIVKGDLFEVGINF